MRFKNEQNELFWKNIIKHNLTRYESKVLIAFVTDAPDYPTSITELFKRTAVKKPHISRALKGLCYQDILFKMTGTYKLNEALLVVDYVPKIISSTAMRKNKDANYTQGNGNFHQQSKNKKIESEKINKNINEMLAKTKNKQILVNKWNSYFSKERSQKIWYFIEQTAVGKRIRSCTGRDPLQDRTVIAPLDIAEEVCKNILNITDPKDMIPYIFSANLDEFLKKYNIKDERRE